MSKITYKEKYDSTSSWFKKAMIINLYKRMLDVRKQPSSVRVLGAYFNVSIGTISEAMLIANNHKLVSRCKTRKDALLLIRENK